MSSPGQIPPPLGVVRRYHRTASVVLVQHDYPVLAARDLHTHSWFHVTLVQRGYYARMYGAREDVHGPGTLSLLPNEDPHTDKYAPGSRCLHVAVLGSVATRLTGATLKGTHAVPPIIAAQFSVALQHEFDHYDGESPLVVELLLSHLLSAHAGLADDRSRAQPPWLKRLLEYLDDTFAEPWSLAVLAAQLCVHPVHLCRSFHQHFHFTLGQYVRSLRLLRARQLLGDRGVTIADVAATCGFADQSHLHHQFKRVVGISPGLYRRIFAAPR
jgi:AraC family transcriptional regulator